MEIITFILATIGSVGTISSWIFTAINNRRKINIEYLDFHITQKGALFYAMISNQSRLPIIIMDISIKINDVYYPVTKISEVVFTCTHRTNNQITSKQEYYSIPFPITLTGISSTSGYLYFPFPEDTYLPSSNNLTLLISTNRGKAIEMKLPLCVDQ